MMFGSEKPASASLTLMTPDNGSATIMMSATASARGRPSRNIATATARQATVIRRSKDIVSFRHSICHKGHTRATRRATRTAEVPDFEDRRTSLVVSQRFCRVYQGMHAVVIDMFIAYTNIVAARIGQRAECP